MLIPLSKCIQTVTAVRRLPENPGVLHIGAHLGEECEDYKNSGFKEIIWVEANKSLIKDLFDKTNPICQPNKIKQTIICSAVSDTDNEEVSFKITNNGQSSSILELGTHLTHHPHVQVVSTRVIKTKRFDTIAKERNLDLTKTKFVNLDIQGAELKALRGFGELLNGFDAVYTEVNSEEVYKGCALITEIDAFLESKGFIRALTAMTEYKWGDALYVRR